MSDLKKCAACGLTKTIHHYYTRGENKQRNECKECWGKKCGSWAKANPKKRAEIALNYTKRKRKEQSIPYIVGLKLCSSRMYAKKYGHVACTATKEELVTKFVTDCEVCGTPVGFRIHLDHCHKTGKFRGFLCGKCNQTIGFADESEEVLLALVEYVRKHK